MEKTIVDWCLELGLKNYQIIDDVVNVNGDVNLPLINLTKIPVQFGVVTGSFNCEHNKLQTLEGCPREVGGYFSCNNNKLTSLIGGPEKVDYFYNCSNNKLTSLIGYPIDLGSKLKSPSSTSIPYQIWALLYKGEKFICHNNPIYKEYKKHNPDKTEEPSSIDDNNKKISIKDLIGKTLISVDFDEDAEREDVIITLKTSDDDTYTISNIEGWPYGNISGVDKILNKPITDIEIDIDESVEDEWVTYCIHAGDKTMEITWSGLEEYISIVKNETN
jgi:hypothetical protein